MGHPVECQTVLFMTQQKPPTPSDFWKYSKQTINSTHGRALTISKMYVEPRNLIKFGISRMYLKDGRACQIYKELQKWTQWTQYWVVNLRESGTEIMIFKSPLLGDVSISQGILMGNFFIG